MSVTDMLYVNQVCHSVRCCVKDGSCSSSSLSESQWTILIDILVSQQMLDAIKHITGDNFFFLEDSALVHCACFTVQLLQRSQLIQHLSEKCDFRVSPFCQVMQRHKLIGAAY